MLKQEFLYKLEKRLSALPQKERKERLAFYAEMIDDRMEEGLSEEEAVSAVGEVKALAREVTEATAGDENVKEPARKSKSPWTTAAIVLGSPVWLSLRIALAAVAVSVYAAVFSVVVSLWAVFAAVIGSSIGAIVLAAAGFMQGSVSKGIFPLGISLFAAGAGIFLFFGCKGVTRGGLTAAKGTTRGIRALCFGRRNGK